MRGEKTRGITPGFLTGWAYFPELTVKNIVLALIIALSGILCASCAAPVFSQGIKLRERSAVAHRDYGPSCKDCYLQQVEIVIPKTGKMAGGADPVCSVPKVVDFFEFTAAVLRSKLDPNVSGDLADLTKRFAYKEVRPKVGASFQAFLDERGPRTPYGTCAPLAAVIPQDAILVEIYLGDWDNKAGAGACIPGKDCNNGGAKFLNTPEIIEQADGGQVIVTVFQNWSHETDRVARMFISYRMPEGKQVVKF